MASPLPLKNGSSPILSPLSTSSIIPKEVPVAPALVVNPTGVAELLFNTMVLYGPTGTHKTMEIGSFAKHIYSKTGKVTRLISLDGGGWGPIQDLINAGIIEAWRLVEEENPKVALIKASRGAWPDKIINGLRASSTIREPLPTQRSVFLKNVGAFAVEGWASISQVVMGDAVRKGQKISQDVVGKFEEVTEYGTEQFGAPSPSHYGFVQRYILDMIRNFSALPVERILYTSLEGKGEDKLTKALQYGPMVAGQAITAVIPTYVGDCLHFEDYTSDVGVSKENERQKLVESRVRIWFTQHPDPQTGVMWPAKPRIVGSKYQEFRSRMGKDGYFEWKPGALGEYLTVQDEMLASSTNEAREWKARVDAERRGHRNEAV